MVERSACHQTMLPRAFTSSMLWSAGLATRAPAKAMGRRSRSCPSSSAQSGRFLPDGILHQAAPGGAIINGSAFKVKRRGGRLRQRLRLENARFFPERVQALPSQDQDALRGKMAAEKFLLARRGAENGSRRLPEVHGQAPVPFQVDQAVAVDAEEGGGLESVQSGQHPRPFQVDRPAGGRPEAWRSTRNGGRQKGGSSTRKESSSTAAALFLPASQAMTRPAASTQPMPPAQGKMTSPAKRPVQEQTSSWTSGELISGTRAGRGGRQPAKRARTARRRRSCLDFMIKKIIGEMPASVKGAPPGARLTSGRAVPYHAGDAYEVPMKKILPVLCLALAFLAAATPSIRGCTTAVVSPGAASDGRPMLWKNRDTDFLNNRITLRQRNPPTPTWRWSMPRTARAAGSMPG